MIPASHCPFQVAHAPDRADRHVIAAHFVLSRVVPVLQPVPHLEVVLA